MNAPRLRYLMRRLARMAGFRPASHPVFLASEYPQYDIGRWTYGELKIYSYNDGTKLRIGSFCSIASNVTILLGGEHRSDWATTYPFSAVWKTAAGFKGHPGSKGDVTIGHDVWIGYGATILSGVDIGTGAVVGAHSVVTRSIPPYGIATGNPARLKRHRFDSPVIARLLASEWWNLPDDKIQLLLPALLCPDVESFLQQVESIRQRA